MIVDGDCCPGCGTRPDFLWMPPDIPARAGEPDAWCYFCAKLAAIEAGTLPVREPCYSVDAVLERLSGAESAADLPGWAWYAPVEYVLAHIEAAERQARAVRAAA